MPAALAATLDTTAVAPSRTTVEQPVPVATGHPAHDTVLISEHEVLFGTSAAGVLRPAAPARQFAHDVHAFFAAIGRVFVAGSDPVAHRRHGLEPGYMERARMSREMGRL